MYRYVVVTDPHTAEGFRLGGVEVAVPADGEELRRTLLDCLDDSTVGLIALNDSFLDQLDPRLARRVESSAFPVVVPFPDPRRLGAGRVENYLDSLIRRAIGYRVRLRT